MYHSSVVRIKAVPRENTYGLGVDKDMSYFANGLLVRNCALVPEHSNTRIDVDDIMRRVELGEGEE